MSSSFSSPSPPTAGMVDSLLCDAFMESDARRRHESQDPGLAPLLRCNMCASFVRADLRQLFHLLRTQLRFGADELSRRSRSRERGCPDATFQGVGSRQTMAKEGQAGLEAITGALNRVPVNGLPPVERWNPPFCGDLDLRIGADGTWYYLKTPIGRPALVKLFASVLKREGDKYFLVTPVEKCGITVDDAPFLAVELKVEKSAGEQVLNFRTNVADWVPCGTHNQLRFEPEP